MIGRVIGWLSAALSGLLIALVYVYRYTLRLVLPSVCRFTPSCSEYFILAVRKYGPLVGAWKGVCRIGRCNPWFSGGFDPP